MLHHRLLDLAHLLRTDLPLAGRISLEDTLIHYSTEDDITAWEHLGLRWSSFPAANRSISRITDKLYQQPILDRAAGTSLLPSSLRLVSTTPRPLRCSTVSRTAQFSSLPAITPQLANPPIRPRSGSGHLPNPGSTHPGFLSSPTGSPHDDGHSEPPAAGSPFSGHVAGSANCPVASR